jgi:hypothetical protein
MPYILTKTNGLTLTTVQDASIDTTTDLSFVGRNYAGYGKIVDQNFVYLLENFANTTPPSKPVQGQLWFNTKTKTLNFSNDGLGFKQLANLSTSSNTTSAAVGDLFWDPVNYQLSVFNGVELILVGPSAGTSSQSYWLAQDVPDVTGSTTLHILQSFIGSTNVAVISDVNNLSVGKTYTALGSTWRAGFAKGITLAGADPITGSSSSQGYYFWGTAAETLKIAGGGPGQLVYQSAADITGFIDPGVSGNILISQGTSSPTFATTGSVHVGYADTALNVAVLSSGIAGQVAVSQGISGVHFVNTSNIHVGYADTALTSNSSTNSTNSINIIGGDIGSIPIQSAPNTTSFIPLGGANSVLHNDGSSVSWVDPNSLGVTGLASRISISGTVSGLAANSSTNLTIVGFKGYALYSVSVSSPAWITVYASIDARTHDAGRTKGTDPAPGSGVIADIDTESTPQIWYFGPAVYGYNAETVPNNNIQLRVYNNRNVTTDITVILTLLQLES